MQPVTAGQPANRVFGRHKIIEPRGSQSLVAEFAGMPHEGTWTRVEPYLVCAAAALSAGQCESSATTLDAAEGMLGRLPAGQEAAGRLAAAMIRLAAARRTGDLAGAAAAAARAEAMAGTVPIGELARHPEIRARVLAGRGAVELWSGHLDQAARILDAGVAAAAAPGGEHERAACLGQLALVEVLRGRLRQAAKLAAQAAAALTADEQQPAHHLDPAALVALAWVHVERNELREAGSRLTQAHAALSTSPDKLVSAVACLAAALSDLAEGHPTAAAEMAAKARCGWPVPPWLEQRLTPVESRARAAAGDIRAALAVAEPASLGSSPEATVTLAHAWAAAGDHNKARHALAPALTAGGRAPGRVRLQAWLADAQLSYDSGDHARGRRSLASALRLGKREQLRLPFALERTWLRPVLRRDPELARAHRQLLGPGLTSPGSAPASQATTTPATPVIVDHLSGREREVLRHASGMLTTAEIASEMYISINTVKSHLKSIYRKLAAGHRGEAVRRARKLGLI
jgi:LuxR family maltose regulon positive regulatory protein